MVILAATCATSRGKVMNGLKLIAPPMGLVLRRIWMLFLVDPARLTMISGLPSPCKSPNTTLSVGKLRLRAGMLVLSNFVKARFPGVLKFCRIMISVLGEKKAVGVENL